MLALAHKRISDRPGQVRRPHLRREGAGRHERGVPVGHSVREARVSDVRGEAVSAVHRDGARRRASRRHGDRARRSAPPTPSSGSALPRSRPPGPLATADHGHHVEFEPLREKLMTPFNWVLLLLMAFCGVVDGGALRPRPRRQHAPLRHLSLGTVDPLRPRLDRRRRGSIRDGRHHLRVSAKGSLFARPNGRADGPAELLVRDGHARRGPRAALALLAARPAVAGSLGHVRGLVVRRPLRHDPAARVPAGRPGALGPSPARPRSGSGGPAPTWRSP